MYIRKYISERIKHRLDVLSINKSQFAIMVGVQPPVVTKWLSGDHNFSLDTLERIEIALKFNLFKYDSDESNNTCFPCIVNEDLLIK